MNRVFRTRRGRGGVLLAVLLVAGGLLVVLGGGAGAAVGAGPVKLNKVQRRLLSGFASFELSQAASPRSSEVTATAKPRSATTKVSPLLGCPSAFGSNVPVNQNCLNISDPDLQGRGQAQNETSIAINPADSGQVVATYNDYRRGDGTCGIDFTTGSGQYQDGTMPNNFVRGEAFGGVSREYFQAGGDPSVAWDSHGNAYYDCMMFERGTPTTNNPDFSSGIYMFRSTGSGGASWNFPGRRVVQRFTTNTSGLPLLDKPYMTIDNHANSPFRDRIYVTWTVFDADGSARIYEANSEDYGETFSSPVLVSTSSSVCTFQYTHSSTTCDENQFSQPFTSPDGTLYVAFANFNTVAPTSKTDNHYQVLLAKSTNGGRTFSSLVRVANYNDLPECSEYQGGQDQFRACVPEKGSNMDSVFRATNYPSGGVNPNNPSQVVVTIGSYINRDSSASNGCTARGFSVITANALYNGVKTPGACNNKILYSVSNDAGARFTGSTTSPEALPVVNQQAGQATTDQYFQWAAFSSNGKLAVSYFDRQYGDDETTGASDVSMSASSDLVTFGTTRVTTSSMPAPTQFPDAQGNSVFYGDYSGLDVSGNTARPLWMDTRNPDLFLCPGTAMVRLPPQICTGIEPDGDRANDQNIYSDTVTLP
jgi:hypothetical protein